jgi:hypothetical protein
MVDSGKVSFPVGKRNGTFQVDLSTDKYKHATWANILVWAVTNTEFIADKVRVDFEAKLDNNVS